MAAHSRSTALWRHVVRRSRSWVTVMVGVAVLLVTSSVAGASLGPASGSSARASSTSTPSGAKRTGTSGLSISVVGNQFVDGSGHRVVLRGVNTEGTLEDCAQPGRGFFADTTITPADYPDSAGNYSTEIAALRAWGVNLVRLNLNEQCWLGTNGVPATTSATDSNGVPYPVPTGDRFDKSVNAYMYQMGSYVHALNDAGVYVELDLMLNAPGSELITGNPVAENPLPDANSVQFWKSVASYFSYDNAVLFDLFNEPYPPDARANYDDSTSWNCTVNGCTVPDYTSEVSNQYTSTVPTTTYAGVGLAELIRVIRQYDTSAPLVAAGPDFAGDMDQWLASYYPGGVSIDPSNELAAGVHVYFPVGASACSASTNVNNSCAASDRNAITQVANVAPVLIDEVGDTTCDNDALFPFLQSVDAVDASQGLDIGYAGWSWTTYSCDPNLISDFSTGTPSSLGEAEYCELLDIGVAPASNPLFDPKSVCAGSAPDATPAG